MSLTLYQWILVAIFFNTVSSQKLKYKFKRDPVALIKCIEKHVSLEDVRYFERTALLIAIADSAGRRFFGKSFSHAEMLCEIMTLTRNLKSERLANLVPDVLFWIDLEDMLLRALTNCSEPEANSNNANLYTNLLRQPVPRFKSEQPILAVVLDYILVEWCISPRDLIRTRNGRVILRSYANSAQILLEYALLNYENNFDAFRNALRRMWYLRALLYFDGHNQRFPYITHVYDKYQHFIYTFSNLKTFSSRSEKHFTLRDPASRSAKYFNYHVKQFYGILFFFMELRALGISDENDIDGPVPNNIMPIRLQEVLTDPTFLNNYLIERRFLEVSLGDRANPIVQRLVNDPFIREEDLIMIVNPHMIGSLIAKSNSTKSNKITTTTISTTLPTTITTPRYERSKKGSVCVSKFGKHFRSKQSNSSPYNRRGNDHDKSDPKSSNKFSNLYFKSHNKNIIHYGETVFDSCSTINLSHRKTKKNNKYYGYFSSNDDVNQLLLDLDSFLKYE